MKRGANRFFPAVVLLTGLGYASYFLSKLVFVALGVPLFLVLTPWPAARQRFFQKQMAWTEIILPQDAGDDVRSL